MVQWKMANYLKGNDPIGDTPIFDFHDFGRKCKDMAPEHSDSQDFDSFSFWQSLETVSTLPPPPNPKKKDKNQSLTF